MTPFIFDPDLEFDIAEHVWTDLLGTPESEPADCIFGEGLDTLEVPPTINPFMRVVAADTARCVRLRRRVADALARIERQPNRPAAGRAAAELLAACALLAADDEWTLVELRAAVRLGARAEPFSETEVARQGYLLFLVDAAGAAAVLAKRRALTSSLWHVTKPARSRTAARPFWTACRALNAALERGDRQVLLRAALRLARAWGGAPRS